LNAIIFSFVKVTPDSMVASTRIATFISKLLEIEICWDTSVAEEKRDVLIIIGGAFGFAGSDILAALGKAVEETGRVIWVQNDYTVIPPKDESGAESPFRAAFRNRAQRSLSAVDYWTTVTAMTTPGTTKGWRIGQGSFYINWNALTFDIDAAERTPPDWFNRARGDSLLYYGSYRKDRVKYFNRYFSTPQVKCVLSSPTRKFESGPSNELVSYEPKIPIRMSTYLAMHGLGLYIEDVKSHAEFHSPANRFYEMLSAGLPMVFQPEATRMMGRAGYDIDPFVVYNNEDVKTMMDRRGHTLEAQRLLWLERARTEYESLAPMVAQNWEKYL